MTQLKKLFITITFIIICGVSLIKDYNDEFIYADNPNQRSSMHTLTGGWIKNIFGTSGKHWTKYTQINNGGKVYASILLKGYLKETNLGTYTEAYVKSNRSVDLYHTHYHSGGMAQ